MPLGLFGGTSSKAQVLNDTPSRGDKKSLNESNCKGVVLKLSNTTVTILKQLAEGGFAIVYLVSDKKNRKFALKRQFVLDNPKQLEACVRESKIVSSLKGHKNIVEYVDHMISLNKFGQHDCMLMTVYHKRNVLQLMNERISSNQFLQPIEILNIFCDMCEAVARLHHSTTPIIHRDLKVENILIDERNSTHPVFVLCDFGSATTQVLSMSTHSAQEIQEEVERNTTLCYRSPEMIDVYGGQEIGIQSDMWSLGVMLYRLCFFTLPFEESALAIQNGIYLPFPTVPDISMAIKAIIYHLLDVDVNRRPTIYECANLAFEAYGKPNPIDNIHKVPKKSLEAAIAEFNESKPRNQRAPPSPAPKHDQTEAECVEQQSTSVNPRNRPKATQVLPAIPAIPGPQELGFTDLDGVSSHRSRAATDSTQKSTQVHVHRRNASDTSQLSKSAFKPYSQTTQKVARNDEEWNPFLSAPMMDDAHFGEAFDEMRRKEHNTEDDASSIDSRDPFGAAPFDPTATGTRKCCGPPSLLRSVLTRDESAPPVPVRTTSRYKPSL